MNEQSRSEPIPEYRINRFAELLRDILNCCHNREIYQSKKFGLPRAELECLLLFTNEHYLTVKHIALRLEIAKSRVSKLIGGLLRKKLVQSINDPHDARVKLISLTTEGRKKIGEIQSFQKEIYHRIIENIDPAYRKNLLFYLEALHIAMEETRIQLMQDAEI